MLKNTIDKLLAMHFKSLPSDKKLGRLESDVWQKINAIQTDKALSWQEKMFLAFGVPEFRFASVTLALLLGLGMGVIMPFEQNNVMSPRQEMGLHVFAANVEYLPSTILEGK